MTLGHLQLPIRLLSIPFSSSAQKMMWPRFPGHKIPSMITEIWNGGCIRWKPLIKINTYTEEFRAAAVKLALDSDQPTAQIARELGVTKSTLYTWIDNHRNGSRKSTKNDDNLLEEVKHLKKENKRLREEREILKKAAVYFAKSVK